ncbi:MAG: tail fiber domain-containing protein [Ignavibacteriae bacterium]|nr:tail fiber domain-containing protein [Ignavibacteriota bacterium]
MKTKIRLIVIYFIALTNIIFSFSLLSQAPQKMSYQAVIRNSSDQLVRNTQVGMRISILKGTAGGTVVFTETQMPTTNANGLISIEIGGGAGFASIDWSSDLYFIKIETDPSGGNDYTISGTSQLLSVPYAFHSNTAERLAGSSNEIDPVFMASPANEITNSNINNWNSAFNWGNHSTAGYLTTEVDGSVNNEIELPSQSGNSGKFLTTDGTNALWTTSSTDETDPVFTASPANNITNANINNWNLAFGWGNHSTAGYLTSEIDGSVTNEIELPSQTGNTGKYLKTDGTIASWSDVSAPGWSLTGNSGTNPTANFVGTTDAQAFVIRTNNVIRTRITTKGQIEILNTGNSVFIGDGAGNSDDLSNNANVFIGYHAGLNNTTGSSNIGIGNNALRGNTTGSSNVAVGNAALSDNTTGLMNTAFGNGALNFSTTSSSNTAVGYQALKLNSTGSSNSALGLYSLYNNDDGISNTACGTWTLYENTSGQYNSASGASALRSNTTGNYNTSMGYSSLYNNTTGSENTAFGKDAAQGGNYNNISAFGYDAAPTASNRVRIGNSSVTQIGGQVGWSTLSDARIKNNIREDVKGLDFIMKLRPVTYTFNKDNADALIGVVDESISPEKYDIERIRFSGFLAQEVEQAAIISGYNFSGVTKPENERDLYSLRYAEFVVPLVKGMQEQQSVIEQLNQRIEMLESQINEMKLLIGEK